MDKLTLILLTFCFTFAYSLPLMTGFHDDVQEGEFEEDKRATVERRTGYHKKHYLGEGFDIYGHHIGSHGKMFVLNDLQYIKSNEFYVERAYSLK